MIEELICFYSSKLELENADVVNNWQNAINMFTVLCF